MKRNIFISYSRHDTHFVNKLSNDLRKKGIDVWIDRENIMPGQMWQKQVEMGFKKASALTFVISKHSIQSQWTIKEFFFSQEVNTPVFF